MQVVLTGAGGQLGLDLADALAAPRPPVAGADAGAVSVTPLDRAALDVANRASVHAAVRDLAPDVVVNCAAWTDVDGCEADEDRCHRVNALGPWWLAEACAATGARLVHLSTDHVFSGAAPIGPRGRPRGWNEFDAIAPGNAYGRAKAAAEELIRATLREHHIVRTSWLSGARGGNFVRTLLELGEHHDRLEVVADQVGAPTVTRDLATAIIEVIAHGRYGTVHRTNQGRCSRADLARAVFALAGLDVEVVDTISARLTRPARRPSWSVLDDRHARTQGSATCPTGVTVCGACCRSSDSSAPAEPASASGGRRP
ncbi:MAG: dTDP-4-dehydrorhamnose reductase [Nitriliruptoraceae bacterium]